jgi:hypothetical protein
MLSIDKSFHLKMRFLDDLQWQLTPLAICVALSSEVTEPFLPMFRERMLVTNLESVGFVPERMPWLQLLFNYDRRKESAKETDVITHMIDHHEKFLQQFPESKLPDDLRKTILKLFKGILELLIGTPILGRIGDSWIFRVKASFHQPKKDFKALVEIHETAKKMEEEAKLTLTVEYSQAGSRDILAAIQQMAGDISELRAEIRDLKAAINQVAKLQAGHLQPASDCGHVSLVR